MPIYEVEDDQTKEILGEVEAANDEEARQKGLPLKIAAQQRRAQQAQKQSTDDKTVRMAAMKDLLTGGMGGGQGLISETEALKDPRLLSAMATTGQIAGAIANPPAGILGGLGRLLSTYAASRAKTPGEAVASGVSELAPAGKIAELLKRVPGLRGAAEAIQGKLDTVPKDLDWLRKSNWEKLQARGRNAAIGALSGGAEGATAAGIQQAIDQEPNVYGGAGQAAVGAALGAAGGAARTVEGKFKSRREVFNETQRQDQEAIRRLQRENAVARGDIAEGRDAAQQSASRLGQINERVRQIQEEYGLKKRTVDENLPEATLAKMRGEMPADRYDPTKIIDQMPESVKLAHIKYGQALEKNAPQEELNALAGQIKAAWTRAGSPRRAGVEEWHQEQIGLRKSPEEKFAEIEDLIKQRKELIERQRNLAEGGARLTVAENDLQIMKIEDRMRALTEELTGKVPGVGKSNSGSADANFLRGVIGQMATSMAHGGMPGLATLARGASYATSPSVFSQKGRPLTALEHVGNWLGQGAQEMRAVPVSQALTQEFREELRKKKEEEAKKRRNR